ncbi:rhoGEF domain-containing protein [Naegleria gruberi]|uniref:RhoGEF domain-containing protein n=1 Tax=Naegleria gruberi TaxID=5762 RepID=D2VEC7_NAEGR|nr:rhoGEF domain-containing protein [Naegleria gruberi]EFC44775.1 rhoGEF domain-containing protein [Naegleria gruberi]|eukprot:XP_002677519.1 rhoGEF domain-containing protein [Naegleria gruberi strain NEG-M]
MSGEHHLIIYDFEATNEGELTVKEGEIIEVMEVYDDGWSLCKRQKQKGLIPSSYYDENPCDGANTPGASSLAFSLNSNNLNLNELQIDDKSAISANKHVSISAGGIKIVRKDLGNASSSNSKLYSPTGPMKHSKTEAFALITKFITQSAKRKKLRDWMSIKENRSFRKRNELVRELLQTEESYVQSLRLFVNSYAKPAKANTQLLSEKKSKIIFSNIEQILGINETVLASLQAAIMKWPSKNELGETFNRMAPFFKAYVTYINNYDAAFELLERCEKKKNKFFQYMSDQTAKNPTEHGLRSLLIMPVQRIPRYKMLLEQILASTPQEHVEYKHYETALKTISDVAVFVNERKRQEDDSNVIFTDLKTKLSKHYKALVKPTRKVIRDYVFRMRTREKVEKEEYRGYIFTDAMIILQEQSGLFNLSKKSFMFVYFSFTKLLGRNGAEIKLSYINGGKETDFSLIAASEEDAKALYETFDERIKSIEESQSFKNMKLDRDCYSVGRERASLAEKRDETKAKLEANVKQFHSSEKKLKKLDQSLQNHEQELKKLVELICREREEKSNTIKEMEGIQVQCADIQVQLKNNLEEIKQRDEILFDKMLHNVGEDFGLVFGEDNLVDVPSELKKAPINNTVYMNSSSSYKHIDIQAILKEVSKVDVSIGTRLDFESDSPARSTPVSSSSNISPQNISSFTDNSPNTPTTTSRPKHILPPPSELRKSMNGTSDLGLAAAKMNFNNPQPPPRPPPSKTPINKPSVSPPSTTNSPTTSSFGTGKLLPPPKPSGSPTTAVPPPPSTQPPPPKKPNIISTPPSTTGNNSFKTAASKFGNDLSSPGKTSTTTSPFGSSTNSNSSSSLRIGGFNKLNTPSSNTPSLPSPRDKPLPKPVPQVPQTQSVTSNSNGSTPTLVKKTPLPPPKKL